MADWSLAQKTPDFIGNAMAAFQAGRERGATRQAGNALAAGNTQGAANAFLTNGMVDQGVGVLDRQRQMQRQDRSDQYAANADQRAQGDQQRQEADFAREDLLRDAYSLRGAPPEQRLALYQQTAVPKLLKMGVPQATIDQATADGALSDQEIDAFIVKMGGEPTKLQALSGANGGLSVFNPYARDPKSAITQVQAPVRPASPGYEWNADGTSQHFIPGGQADPHVAGALAGSKRAPKAAGGGGGTVPALPPGFVMEK